MRHERRRERAGAAEALYLYGVHAVSAWLAAHPQRVRALFYDEGIAAAAPLLAQARACGVPARRETAEALRARCASARHQGVVAEVAPFPYAELATLIDAAPAMLVLADQIQDPHNLGAVMRSAEAAGAGGLVLPRDHAAGVTPAAEVAAAGAAAWLPVCRVTNLVRTLDRLRDAGYWSVGLDAAAEQDIFSFDPPAQVALLVGGETGIRPLVARQLDFRVRIPMAGRSESLNASVAAALGLFILRQRQAAPAAAG